MLRTETLPPTEYKNSALALSISTLQKVAADLVQEYFPMADGLNKEASDARHFLIATQEALQFFERELMPQIDKRQILSRWWIARQMLTTNKLMAAQSYYATPSKDALGIAPKIRNEHEAISQFAKALLKELRNWPTTLAALLPFVDYDGIVSMLFEPGRVKDYIMNKFGIPHLKTSDVESYYQSLLSKFIHELEIKCKSNDTPEPTPELDTEKLDSNNITRNTNEETPMLRQTLIDTVTQKDVKAFLFRLRASEAVVKSIVATDATTDDKIVRIDGQIKFQNDSYTALVSELNNSTDAGYTQAASALHEMQDGLLHIKAEILTADVHGKHTERYQQAIAWLEAEQDNTREYAKEQMKVVEFNTKRVEELPLQSGNIVSIIKNAIANANTRILQAADKLNANIDLTKKLEAIDEAMQKIKLSEKSVEQIVAWRTLEIAILLAAKKAGEIFSNETDLPEYVNLQTYFANTRKYVDAMLNLCAQQEANEDALVKIIAFEADRITDLAIAKLKPLEQGRVAGLADALASIESLRSALATYTHLTQVRKEQVENVYVEKAKQLDEAREQEEARVRDSANCKRHLVMQRIDSFIEDKKVFYKGKYATKNYETELTAISNALKMFACSYDGTIESNRYLLDIAALTDKYPGWNLAELQRKINSVAKIDGVVSPTAAVEIVVPVTYKEAQKQFDKAIMDMARSGMTIYQDGHKKSLTLGAATLDLALELAGMKNEFFRDASKVNSQEEFNKFQTRFFIVLHSRDDVMNEHRARWKVIIANIAIALTGIGALILAGRAVASCVTGKPAMFFTHTNRRQQLDRIEKSLDVMAKEQVGHVRNLTAPKMGAA